MGNVTVYKHAGDTGMYYVVEGKKAQDQYTEYPLSLRAFRADYFYLWEAMLDKRLFYSSAAVKVRFERVWNL